MKKTLVLIAVLAVMVALSVPVSAQDWVVSWSDSFEGYVGESNLGGQDSWVKVGTATQSGRVEDDLVRFPVDEDKALTGEHYFQQVAAVKSASSNDMRRMVTTGAAFKEAFFEAWVWDPLAGATPTTDTRVGLYSTAGSDNIGKILSANITSGSGLTGDAAYWRAQWSYSAVSMNGATPAGGAGYTFTGGTAAPRVAGWNKVWIYFSMNETLTAWHCDWYINPDPNVPLVNLSLDCSTAAGTRWTNFHDVAGVYIGAYNVSSNIPGRVDDLAFYGNPISGEWKATPEPSSILALGTGLLGLIGVIRRKR